MENPIIKKYYELKPWDKAFHDEILTFQKVDWMYAQWKDKFGFIRIWNALEYELQDDWIYYPITTELWATGN